MAQQYRQFFLRRFSGVRVGDELSSLLVVAQVYLTADPLGHLDDVAEGDVFGGREDESAYRATLLFHVLLLCWDGNVQIH